MLSRPHSAAGGEHGKAGSVRSSGGSEECSYNNTCLSVSGIELALVSLYDRVLFPIVPSGTLLPTSPL